MDRHVICTAALHNLGARSIQSFEDGTTEADLCRSNYERAVRAMLALHPWNFAEARVRLAGDATAAGPDYTYSYELPRDYVGARHTLDTNGYITSDGYRIIGRKLLSDEGTPYLVYTRRAAEQDFPPLFTEALIYKLSSNLAGPITGSEAMVEKYYTLYVETLRLAKLADSQQDTPQVIYSDILTAWHTG
jgi:hypothetical protein